MNNNNTNDNEAGFSSPGTNLPSLLPKQADADGDVEMTEASAPSNVRVEVPVTKGTKRGLEKNTSSGQSSSTASGSNSPVHKKQKAQKAQVKWSKREAPEDDEEDDDEELEEEKEEEEEEELDDDGDVKVKSVGRKIQVDSGVEDMDGDGSDEGVDDRDEEGEESDGDVVMEDVPPSPEEVIAQLEAAVQVGDELLAARRAQLGRGKTKVEKQWNKFISDPKSDPESHPESVTQLDKLKAKIESKDVTAILFGAQGQGKSFLINRIVTLLGCEDVVGTFPRVRGYEDIAALVRSAGGDSVTDVPWKVRLDRSAKGVSWKAHVTTPEEAWTRWKIANPSISLERRPEVTRLMEQLQAANNVMSGAVYATATETSTYAMESVQTTLQGIPALRNSTIAWTCLFDHIEVALPLAADQHGEFDSITLVDLPGVSGGTELQKELHKHVAVHAFARDEHDAVFITNKGCRSSLDAELLVECGAFKRAMSVQQHGDDVLGSFPTLVLAHNFTREEFHEDGNEEYFSEDKDRGNVWCRVSAMPKHKELLRADFSRAFDLELDDTNSAPTSNGSAAGSSRTSTVLRDVTQLGCLRHFIRNLQVFVEDAYFLLHPPELIMNGGQFDFGRNLREIIVGCKLRRLKEHKAAAAALVHSMLAQVQGCVWDFNASVKARNSKSVEQSGFVQPQELLDEVRKQVGQVNPDGLSMFDVDREQIEAVVAEQAHEVYGEMANDETRSEVTYEATKHATEFTDIPSLEAKIVFKRVLERIKNEHVRMVSEWRTNMKQALGRFDKAKIMLWKTNQTISTRKKDGPGKHIRQMAKLMIDKLQMVNMLCSALVEEWEKTVMQDMIQADDYSFNPFSEDVYEELRRLSGTGDDKDKGNNARGIVLDVLQSGNDGGSSPSALASSGGSNQRAARCKPFYDDLVNRLVVLGQEMKDAVREQLLSDDVEELLNKCRGRRLKRVPIEDFMVGHHLKNLASLIPSSAHSGGSKHTSNSDKRQKAMRPTIPVLHPLRPPKLVPTGPGDRRSKLPLDVEQFASISEAIQAQAWPSRDKGLLQTAEKRGLIHPAQLNPDGFAVERRVSSEVSSSEVEGPAVLRLDLERPSGGQPGRVYFKASQSDWKLIDARLSTLGDRAVESVAPIFIPSRPRRHKHKGKVFLKPMLHVEELLRVRSGSGDEAPTQAAAAAAAAAGAASSSAAAADSPSQPKQAAGSLDGMVFVFVVEPTLEWYRNLWNGAKLRDVLCWVVMPEGENGVLLGLGRKRTLMKLVAEHFELPVWHMIDDDLQFAEKLRLPKYQEHDTAFVRALRHNEMIIHKALRNPERATELKKQLTQKRFITKWMRSVRTLEQDELRAIANSGACRQYLDDLPEEARIPKLSLEDLGDEVCASLQVMFDARVHDIATDPPLFVKEMESLSTEVPAWARAWKFVIDTLVDFDVQLNSTLAMVTPSQGRHVDQALRLASSQVKVTHRVCHTPYSCVTIHSRALMGLYWVPPDAFWELDFPAGAMDTKVRRLVNRKKRDALYGGPKGTATTKRKVTSKHAEWAQKYKHVCEDWWFALELSMSARGFYNNVMFKCAPYRHGEWITVCGTRVEGDNTKGGSLASGAASSSGAPGSNVWHMGGRCEECSKSRFGW